MSQHCVAVLGTETNETIFKDCLAVLTHLLNHGNHYLIGLKGQAIESVLSLLTEETPQESWFPPVTQVKLLNLAVQSLSKFDRLTPTYVSILVPFLISTINSAKKNFSLSKNEQLLSSSLKSLIAILRDKNLPKVHVDALPKIVRIAVGYAGKCNWETFGVVTSFLLSCASHPDANPGLAWGVVEVLCDRRWEDGKRRRGGEDVVTKCVAAWVRIYEEFKVKKVSMREVRSKPLGRTSLM